MSIIMLCYFTGEQLAVAQLLKCPLQLVTSATSCFMIHSSRLCSEKVAGPICKGREQPVSYTHLTLPTKA